MQPAPRPLPPPCSQACWGRPGQGLGPRSATTLSWHARPVPLQRPARRGGSALAGVDLLPLGALPALHVAAPAHLALARPGHHPTLCVVAAPAADALAVLLTVAPAAGSAWGEAASHAEAGGVVQVHQLRRAGQGIAAARPGGPAPWRRDGAGLAGGLVGGAAHLKGRLVLVLQALAHLVERRELPPARPHGARAGHAMALARGLHPSLDHLARERGAGVRATLSRLETTPKTTLRGAAGMSGRLHGPVGHHCLSPRLPGSHQQPVLSEPWITQDRNATASTTTSEKPPQLPESASCTTKAPPSRSPHPRMSPARAGHTSPRALLSVLPRITQSVLSSLFLENLRTSKSACLVDRTGHQSVRSELTMSLPGHRDQMLPRVQAPTSTLPRVTWKEGESLQRGADRRGLRPPPHTGRGRHGPAPTFCSASERLPKTQAGPSPRRTWVPRAKPWSQASCPTGPPA